MITDRTSQLSHLPWATSVGVHAAVIAVLGTLLTVPVVEKAEIAGSQTVINAAFAEPVASAEPPPVTVEQVDETEIDAPPDESDPEPLSPDMPHTMADLGELPPSEIELSRRTAGVAAADASVPHTSIERPPLPVSARRRPVTPRSEQIIQQKPQPESVLPRLPRQQRVIEDVAEIAEAELPPVAPPAKPQSLGTSETTPAQVLDNPSPVYPPNALQRGLEGMVVLRVTIGPQGRVTDIAVAKSSGIRQFDESALQAVRNWRFQPAARDGHAIEWTARLPVRFRLK